jgi:hypothetical protein
MLSQLVNQPLVALSFEGSPIQIHIITLSTKNRTYLIDAVALADSAALDKALCQVFRGDKTTTLVFALFKGAGYSKAKEDLSLLRTCMPKMEWFLAFN